MVDADVQEGRTMDTNEPKITELRQKITSGEYRVDEQVLADALIKRIRAVGRRLRRAQNWCSYPESGPDPSVKQAPGSPSTTRPIQVSPPQSASCRWASEAHDSGKHAQSS